MIGNIALVLNLAGLAGSAFAVRRLRQAIIDTRIGCYTNLVEALGDAAQVLLLDDQPTTLTNVLTQVRIAYEVRARIDIDVREAHP